MSETTLPDTAQPPGPLPRVDGRTRFVMTVRRTRNAVTQALGGPDAVTPQQVIAIRMLAEAEALRQTLFAQAANGEAFSVGDYAALATQGQRALKLLGMRRIAKDVPSLRDYIESHAGHTETAQDTRSTATPAADTGDAA
jgi:hypothetical protein